MSPVISERDVRLELARDAAKSLASERDAERQAAAPASVLEVHPSTVIAMGLELEELQCVNCCYHSKRVLT